MFLAYTIYQRKYYCKAYQSFWILVKEKEQRILKNSTTGSSHFLNWEKIFQTLYAFLNLKYFKE